jgi:hypothetical protein
MIKPCRFISVALFTLLLSAASFVVDDARVNAQTGDQTALSLELAQFGEIDLFVFEDRAAFLARIDETLGLENIKSPEATFAKLPRSPFTITGVQNGAHLGRCQIFVPTNITPQSGNEIFAELLRGWFGKTLSYATDPSLTYRWLIIHEARHCEPDHFGGDTIEEHGDEIAADLFAFEELATRENKAALARDIVAFRMLSSALMADASHMIGLSIRHSLNGETTPKPSATQEINAFGDARKRISAQAKAIATGINPSNLELVRAITELREAVETGTLSPDVPFTADILIALDEAVAHFAPRLHQSVATRKPN